MKTVGKTTRPFRYDLNQILFDYTVDVTNRFKGLDLIDRVPEKLWTEVHNIVQEAIIKTIPKKKKCRKAKWFSVFHGGSVVKNPPANARDVGSIPGLGRSPGGGRGNPLQCPCLGNPMDRGAWGATVHGVTKSQTSLRD